ncbi:hypothetical protein BC827DRAFT_1158621 [Russula dissimulans]|nr:hypothetical protein BC827DRAFT_1158621 [Russula dissimulans]
MPAPVGLALAIVVALAIVGVMAFGTGKAEAMVVQRGKMQILCGVAVRPAPGPDFISRSNTKERTSIVPPQLITGQTMHANGARSRVKWAQIKMVVRLHVEINGDEENVNEKHKIVFRKNTSVKTMSRQKQVAWEA